MTLHKASVLVGGEVLGGDDGVPITRWTYDSRLPAAPDGNCFLALKTGRRSGVSYVDELLERGVRLFCVSVPDVGRLSPKQLARGTFWVVEDVLTSVQALAAEHRKSLTGEIVAITGSNGKTIVKEWLYRLLTAAGFTAYRSPASYNSQLGVALSVLHDRQEGVEVHIFEAGVSEAGEMAALREMIRPTFGILTNIGAAHDAGFESRAAKLSEKLSLFDGVGGLVYDADDGAVAINVREWDAGLPLKGSVALAGWGQRTDATNIDAVTFLGGEVVLRLVSGVDGPLVFTFPCPFADAASRQNLAHALVTAGEARTSHRPPIGKYRLQGYRATLREPSRRWPVWTCASRYTKGAGARA